MAKGASSATARQRPGAVTFARLTPYLRGIIYGLRMADYGVQDIIKEVEKADGAPPSRSAVLRSLALSDRLGGLAWDGVVPSAASRNMRERPLYVQSKSLRAHACQCHSVCDAMCARARRGLRQRMVPHATRQPTTRESYDVGIFTQLLKRVCAALKVTTIGHRQVAK